MALNWTTIDTAVKAWLSAAAPAVTWFRGDQDIPRPALPCGQWTWATIGERLDAQGPSPDDAPVRAIAPSSTFRQPLHYRRHRLEIQVYAAATVGTTAAAYAQAVAEALELEGRRIALAAAGLVVRIDGGAVDATALLGYAAESRAMVEAVVYTTDSQTEEVGRIEAVTPLTGTLET